MKKRNLIRLSALAGVLFALAPASAQQPKPGELSKNLKSEVVESLAKSLIDDYIFPEMGAKVASEIRAKQKSGAYSKITDSGEFAQKLTDDMRAVAHDKHLGVRYFGHMVKDVPTEDQKKVQEKIQSHVMKVANYGFRKAEILPGNVGYLKIDGFAPTDLAKNVCDATMVFLQNTDAMIIDLRENGGGDPDMVRFLASYFFKANTHINDLYYRKGNKTEEYRTTDPAGKRYENPVYILTSGRTFSGGEEFAYDFQTQKRATLFGETTGGGANPGDEVALKGNFSAFMPNGRAVNPITKTNWEGVGVVPDVAMPANDALQFAHEIALKSLLDSAPEEHKNYFQRALDRVSKKANP